MTRSRASQPSTEARSSSGPEITIPVSTAAGAEEAAFAIERDLASMEEVDGAVADLIRHEVLARHRASGAPSAEKAIRARIGAFGWTASGASSAGAVDPAQQRAARGAALRASVATLAAALATLAGALTAPGSLAPFLQLAPDLQASIRRSIPIGAATALWIVVGIAAAAIGWGGRAVFANAFRDVARGIVTRRLLASAAVGTLFLGATAGAAMTILGRPGPPLLFGAALWCLAAALATDALTLGRAARRRARESQLDSALRARLAAAPWHRSSREKRSLSSARWWAVIALIGGAIAAAAWIAAGQPWSIAILAAAGVFLAAAPAAFIAAAATPVRGAIERLDRSGIAIRGGRTLDRIRAAGTLATNIRGGVCDSRARLAEVLVLEGTSMDGLLEAAAAAAPADHPIGGLIRQRAGTHTAGRPHAAIGTAEEMTRRGIATEAIAEDVERFESEGKAVLAVAENGRVLGAVTVAFDERPDAARTIEWLNQRGLRTVLLTSHDAGTTRALMERFGFAVSESGLANPFDSTLLRAESGKLNAWISNGEDADSARRADIAIAFGATVDPLADHDAVVTTGSFDSLRQLIEEADRTERAAARRSRWLVAYHLVALPIAGGALLPATGLLPSPFLAALGSLAALTLASLPGPRTK